MTEKDVSQGFRLKKIKEMNNHFIKEIHQNELLRNKNKKVCTTLNYIEHSLTLFWQLLYVFPFLVLLLQSIFLMEL